MRGLQHHYVVGGLGEAVEAALGHHAAVLQPHAEAISQIDARLHGDHVAGRKRRLVARGEHRQLVDLKAHAVADTLGLPALADDSGLEVDALNGAPGVYSARYGLDIPALPGENDDARNNRKLLAALAGVPHPRTGRFRCCMALARPGRPDLTVHGVWEGHIADAPSGGNGFGYDPLFFDPELGRISAELTREEKNARSHRGKALRLLLGALEKERTGGGAGTPA